MAKRNWLEVAEYITITASVGGTIATFITKQVILTATPLTLALALNVINRQRQLQDVRKLPEHHKLIEIHDDLISFHEEYRFCKLEIEEKLKSSEAINEQKIISLESLLQKMSEDNQKQVNLIYQKTQELENNIDKSRINHIYELYSSLIQRLEGIENSANSSLEQAHFIAINEQKIISLKSLLQKMSEDNQKQINILYQKIQELDNKSNKSIINASLSANQRLENLENLVNSSLVKERFVSSQESNKQPIETSRKITSNFINDTQKQLDELDLAFLRDVAYYFEKIPDTIRQYYRDHNASREEADVIANYYLKTASMVRKVKTVQDLKELLKNLDVLKEKVSRYNHESYKYRLSKGLEKEVIVKLKKIIDKNDNIKDDFTIDLTEAIRDK